jgi:hypothetical protein
MGKVLNMIITEGMQVRLAAGTGGAVFGVATGGAGGSGRVGGRGAARGVASVVAFGPPLLDKFAHAVSVLNGVRDDDPVNGGLRCVPVRPCANSALGASIKSLVLA